MYFCLLMLVNNGSCLYLMKTNSKYLYLKKCTIPLKQHIHDVSLSRVALGY